MRFCITDNIKENVDWYKQLLSEECVRRYHPQSIITITDFSSNIELYSDDVDIAEDHIDESSDYDTILKSVQVEFQSSSNDTTMTSGLLKWTMTLFELRDMNHWFAEIYNRELTDISHALVTQTIWNVFLCELWSGISDIGQDIEQDNNDSNRIWICDSNDNSIKNVEPLFGVYYQNSSNLLPTTTRQRVYFSITAETFFMHSISEEVYRPSNTIYLVGKLFPHWKTREEHGHLECRIYEGRWARAPSGFRVKTKTNPENPDELYVYKSKWLVRSVDDVVIEQDDGVRDVNIQEPVINNHQYQPVEYTEDTINTNADDTTTASYPTKYRRRRIHIVSEFVVLWEWLRIWFNVYMLDEPLRLYKYNHRGERSRIQYVFTKDECNELYTQLFYEGTQSYEWFSKILVECMSIRWNRYVVFEEWTRDTEDPALEYVIPSNTGKRITYNTYKKARLVSKRIGRGVVRRMERGQYYPIRMLYTGFDDDVDTPSHAQDNDSRVWFDSQKDAFVTVWINKKGDEITMSCVSPSSELIQWKKEFDYFLSQWFPIITK